MTSRDFCYWLQGYFELREKEGMSQEQVECVARHLALVFKHEIDPSMGSSSHQADLNKTHQAPHPNPKPMPQIGGVDPITGAVYRC
jgi:hypothetical protein